jgi:acyl-CoA thioesterase FadM
VYPFFRFLKVLVLARFAPRVEPDALVVTRLRVWPWDLDFNLHLNNGRYMTLMDLGRADLIARSGLVGLLMRRRWAPVLASSGIRFRRSLAPFQAFDLTTRIVYWDEKWFYIHQEFVRDGDVYARALVKGLFVGPGGNVPIRRLMEAIGIERPTPVRPEVIDDWLAFEKEMR